MQDCDSHSRPNASSRGSHVRSQAVASGYASAIEAARMRWTWLLASVVLHALAIVGSQRSARHRVEESRPRLVRVTLFQPPAAIPAGHTPTSQSRATARSPVAARRARRAKRPVGRRPAPRVSTARRTAAPRRRKMDESPPALAAADTPRSSQDEASASDGRPGSPALESPAAPGPRAVSEVAHPPVPLHRARPKYPSRAKRLRIMGRVRLEAVVDRNGVGRNERDGQQERQYDPDRNEDAEHLYRRNGR